MTSAVAKRYARALFALATEGGTVSDTGSELASIARAFGEPPLKTFADDTTLDRRTREAATAKIARAIGLSRLLENFLGVVAEHGRLRWIAAIAEEYQRLEDRALGRVRARITTAHPLSGESEKRILDALGECTGKQVLTNTEVDPSLLGGVVVEIGGRVFDGSLRTRLERLRQSLSR
jgi:F-type H+-transporting ATPase subunit delta